MVQFTLGKRHFLSAARLRKPMPKTRARGFVESDQDLRTAPSPLSRDSYDAFVGQGWRVIAAPSR